jgi:hypothetical protein
MGVGVFVLTLGPPSFAIIAYVGQRSEDRNDRATEVRVAEDSGQRQRTERQGAEPQNMQTLRAPEL